MRRRKKKQSSVKKCDNVRSRWKTSRGMRSSKKKRKEKKRRENEKTKKQIGIRNNLKQN
jgi:hypothetical protein